MSNSVDYRRLRDPARFTGSVSANYLAYVELTKFYVDFHHRLQADLFTAGI